MTRAVPAPIAACVAVVTLLAVSGIVVSPPCRADDCPPGTIVTIAGTGGSIYQGPGQYPGDGGPATEAKISEPCDLALGPDGSLYIADRDAHRIRKVDLKTGTITTFAGNGVEGYSGDGGPAAEANLKYPYAVALGPDGSLYIADSSNDRVRKVDPAGVITTVAGTGTRGYSGDGGPATRADLYHPSGLAVAPDGTLYIVVHRRIRKVDPAGVITTIAGDGGTSPPRDGVPATAAGLTPVSIALAPDGSLYVAQVGNERVLKITPAGIIITVAGACCTDDSSDGVPATEVRLSFPHDVVLGLDGSFYIADAGDSRVRKVDPDGIITTVAGTGARGYSGDGGPATAAELQAPAALALGPDGSLYIADPADHRIRKICGPKSSQP